VSLFIAVLFASCRQMNSSDSPILLGEFFGKDCPANKFVIFAPGIVSTVLNEGFITFSPDDKECYWSILFSDLVTIVTSKLENGKWTKPKAAPFAGKYYDGWPAIESDGKRMFFHSSRPVADTSAGITAKFNVWYVDRTENGYILFARIHPRGSTNLRIFSIYISFKNKDNSWTEPKELGEKLNMDGNQSRISPDGKYFFFVGNDGMSYWVSAKIIEELRPN